MSRVVIIGGGAAGMFAAITAAKNGHIVDLYEKNEKLGKKIFITGKGRCNLTNACDTEELFDQVCTNSKFLYSAFYGFTNFDTIRFFEECGMPTKIERGNRVFPVSDHSSDVIQALKRKMDELGVHVHLNTEVKEVLTEGKEKPTAAGIRLRDKTTVKADAVIVSTGGLSYAATGSTGDGYRFAKSVGHQVTELAPSLVPMITEGEECRELQGLSLKNVRVTVLDKQKILYEDFGEMMFTHFGVTGPLILSASTKVWKKLSKNPLTLSIDLKPALTDEQLDARILREFEQNKNKQFKNSLGAMFPSKIIPVIIRKSGIDPEKPVHDISREERMRLLDASRRFTMKLTGLRGYQEAVITRGGVSVREINPSTMESKLVSGLYFAGEVLDLDAVTGGFNLQIAWSTGYAAGNAI